MPAAELGAELLELVGPAARALGGEALLERIDPRACEADVQLAAERAGRSGGSRRRTLADGVASVTETIQVSGIRCEQCVMRLAKTLEGTEGLEFANANLMGQVLAHLGRRASPPATRCSRRSRRWLPRAGVR